MNKRDTIGNQLCFKGKKAMCSDVEKDGERYYLVKNGSKRVVMISKIEKDNSI